MPLRKQVSIFLFLLALFCSLTFVATATKIIRGTIEIKLKQDNIDPEFEALIVQFNKALKTKNTKVAIANLTKAEHLLTDLKGIDLTSMYTALAYAFARLNNHHKAEFYQQKATAISRGKTISIENLNILTQSYVLLNDKNGIKNTFEKIISNAPRSEKTALKIAYVNGLYGVDENLKASTLLTELYSDTPLNNEEQAEILSLLIINSLKLNQLQQLDQFYRVLEELKPKKSPNYLLAKGMYLEFKNNYTKAKLNYHQLFIGFKAGNRNNIYLEGLLQLAQLNSKQLKKDSAVYYFNILASVLHKPYQNTAIGLRYLKLYQAHQIRFSQTDTNKFNATLNTKDSLYKNELIAVTKELTYKYKIEQAKQKTELDKKERALAAVTYEKKQQQFLLVIACLCLLIIAASATIYILHERRKQGSLLHLAELERLKQLQKTELIKKISASQEAERWRIADQLHDEVGSMISVVRLNLSEHPFRDEGITAEKLEAATRILANVADTVREMSHQLMPVAIRQYGLINAIRQLINDINISGKIYIEELIYGFDDLSKYPEDFQISFYRIIQELFQNIVKHAKATNAIFQLIEHPDSINLYIEDNGKGIAYNNNEGSGKGIGLLTNRIDYFEGKISIEGQPGKGTLIVIDIPTTYMKSKD